MKVVHIPKGTVTYHRVSVIDERPASDIPSQTAILQEDGVVAATKQKVRIWVTGTVQQRGQFVAIVWSGQRQKYSNIDMAVLRGLAQDETHVLGTTPLS